MQGIETDTKTGKQFVKSEINKMNDSYRSPFSQEYFPDGANKLYITPKMTKFEKGLNVCLEEYAKLNYLVATPSAFCFDNEKYYTVVLFIHSPVDSEFGILKSAHNNLRVTMNIELIKSSKEIKDYSVKNIGAANVSAEIYDEISISISENDPDEADKRTSKISSTQHIAVNRLSVLI